MNKDLVTSKYIMWMRILAALYLTAAVLIFFFPSQLIYLINSLPKMTPFYEVIPETDTSFWVVFAAAQMVTLSAICFLCSMDPRNHALPFVHLATKLVTGGAFIYLFLTETRYFAYLVGAGIELILTLFLLYWMVRMAIRRPYEVAPVAPPPIETPEPSGSIDSYTSYSPPDPVTSETSPMETTATGSTADSDSGPAPDPFGAKTDEHN